MSLMSLTTQLYHFEILTLHLVLMSWFALEKMLGQHYQIMVALVQVTNGM